MDATQVFDAERDRLVRLAARVLRDPVEAEDIVQVAWLRWDQQTEPVESAPAWLTTVTTRLCLDRLRARVPEPAPTDVEAPSGSSSASDDPEAAAELADSVGSALALVVDRLTPAERIAFVLHDAFGFEFALIAAALDVSPAAARQLASRARRKVRGPVADAPAHGEVVDAFMAAARGGDFDRLIALLAPDASVSADTFAVEVGTPERIEGRGSIAEFFNGSAHAALPVSLDGRPAYAWYHRGRARVVFDFDVADGVVQRLTFRAEPEVLLRVRPNEGVKMKTMTCRDLGGPCDLAHRGESADDVIQAQDHHLKEAEKAGDASHQEARDAMKGRWRRPKKSLDWYRAMQQRFAELPES